jgi:hypothetical protein
MAGQLPRHKAVPVLAKGAGVQIHAAGQQKADDQKEKQATQEAEHGIAGS